MGTGRPDDGSIIICPICPDPPSIDEAFKDRVLPLLICSAAHAATLRARPSFSSKLIVEVIQVVHVEANSDT